MIRLRLIFWRLMFEHGPERMAGFSFRHFADAVIELKRREDA